MLKIWGLWVKGLQGYWPSNFENDSTPGVLEYRPIARAHSSVVKAKMAEFFVRPPTLTAGNFEAI